MATSTSDSNRLSFNLILILSVYTTTTFLHCDAGRAIARRGQEWTSMRHYDEMWSTKFDSIYGIGSPFSLPPFESLAPVSMPQQGGGSGGSSQITPPYCFYPPFTPTPITPINPYSPPSLYIPPIFPILSPPLPPSLNPFPPPQSTLTPPNYLPTLPPPGRSGGGEFAPNPPQSTLTPPNYLPGLPPSPPSFTPTPGGSGGGGGGGGGGPSFTPTPGGSGGGRGGGGGGGGQFAPNPPTFGIPSPPIFQPPVIYPPPSAPPPPQHHGESLTLWCVAKPSVPDPILQEAMNYACGSGADCNAIQPNGNCYQPNTLLEHASYAFNSYWQMTKVGGGTCEFGGTAILVTVDPSYDSCHFLII